MASEPVTCWRVDYLTCYWSDMYALEPSSVPADQWRTAVDYFSRQDDAFSYAARKAHESKQVYAVVEVTSRRVITIDPVNPDMT